MNSTYPNGNVPSGAFGIIGCDPASPHQHAPGIAHDGTTAAATSPGQHCDKTAHHGRARRHRVKDSPQLVGMGRDRSDLAGRGHLEPGGALGEDGADLLSEVQPVVGVQSPDTVGASDGNGSEKRGNRYSLLVLSH